MPGPDKRYMVIGNPSAGRGKGLRVFNEACRVFRSRGLNFKQHLSKGPGDIAKTAAEAVDDYDVVVGVGGDGTLNEILRGVMFSGRPLGVIPAGSGNDFAKCLNIQSNTGDAVRVIDEGQIITADAGRFDEVLFLNGVGIGFDAAVNHATKKIIHLKGFSAYLWAMIKTLSEYKPIPLKITMDGTIIEKEMFLAAIGNGTTCGGGFRLNPSAKIDDHLLDVNIIDPVSVAVLLRHLPKVFLGTIGRTGYSTMKRASHILIESQSPFPVHIDGEAYFMDSGRHTIEVLPAAFKVIGNF